MPIKLLQSSIVLTGTGFSPGHIDPISLSERGIVPNEWEWVVASNVTTPVASAITYENGVAIIVEASKFQITEQDVTNLGDNRVTEIVRNYVSKFSQIGYTAVGLNFRGIVPMSESTNLIQERFLTEELLRLSSNELLQVGLRLMYSIDGGQLHLNVDEGKAERAVNGTSESYTGLMFGANHHRLCTSRPAGKQVLEFLNLRVSDWQNLQALISRIAAVSE